MKFKSKGGDAALQRTEAKKLQVLYRTCGIADAKLAVTAQYARRHLPLSMYLQPHPGCSHGVIGSVCTHDGIHDKRCPVVNKKATSCFLPFAFSQLQRALQAMRAGALGDPTWHRRRRAKGT